MSTYLVAFLVGDFQCSKGESDGVAIRVCSTPDKVALTPYGVDVAKYVLHYYNNYFGIPYPLKKLDLIAMPDFEAGAMENFGAITYRETDLLIDSKTASVGAKKEVALVIAHEMAHQWFGDLVTMQWWDNIWLNEGFATWMENKPVAAMHPEWNIDQDVAAGLNGTLNLDAQPTTRAIRAKADTPDEINQMFDGIAYGKAGAVLLMVENYLGEETFRQGVHATSRRTNTPTPPRKTSGMRRPPPATSPSTRSWRASSSSPASPSSPSASPPAARSPSPRSASSSAPQSQPAAEKWTLPVCFKTASNDQGLPGPHPRHLHPQGAQCQPLLRQRRRQRLLPQRLPARRLRQIVAGVETALTPVERISLIGDQWAQVRGQQGHRGRLPQPCLRRQSRPQLGSHLQRYGRRYLHLRPGCCLRR